MLKMLKNKKISEKLLILSVVSLVAVGAISHLTGCQDKSTEAPKKADNEKTPQTGPGQANRITVTQKQIIRLGIRKTDAKMGSVTREIRAPGEIKLNLDKMAHVALRAAGVVREVRKVLGDSVKADETLAWIESDKLAGAKLDFYAKESEIGCCDIKLPRAKAIFENVAKLTALLAKEASESEISKLNGLEMGKYRGAFLKAYTAYRAARTHQKREAELHAKKISSGQDLLNAETALSQARAAFQATVDTARYETLIAYTEAVQERQLAVFNAVAAEKLLRLKGADDKTINELRSLVPKPASLKPCLCDDPNCKSGQLPSLAKELSKDGQFSRYALRAPFDGTIVKKHIVMGESVDESAEVFAIANLSDVWVDLAISQDNISLVHEGYAVTVTLPNGMKTEGKVAFISPIVAADTRTAMARVVLPNPERLLRPGTFVDAAIKIPADKEAVVIPKTAIQLVHDHTCVFVLKGMQFELREVVTGVTDGTQIEILKGLQAGESVASVNAFHLKAEFAKLGAGDAGAHAGHSH
ncbi:MAG: efflux RND transporter periplasmic adaptor subunit [Phycisphaerales bacterium]|jgi:membrane fusion protein, heavy metal efflux system|nr:efflux RND transporter periplasmic adaptor subunit [Phycisphaerales bacterium]